MDDATRTSKFYLCADRNTRLTRKGCDHWGSGIQDEVNTVTILSQDLWNASTRSRMPRRKSVQPTDRKMMALRSTLDVGMRRSELLFTAQLALPKDRDGHFHKYSPLNSHSQSILKDLPQRGACRKRGVGREPWHRPATYPAPLHCSPRLLLALALWHYCCVTHSFEQTDLEADPENCL